MAEAPTEMEVKYSPDLRNREQMAWELLSAIVSMHSINWLLDYSEKQVVEKSFALADEFIKQAEEKK